MITKKKKNLDRLNWNANCCIFFKWERNKKIICVYFWNYWKVIYFFLHSHGTTIQKAESYFLFFRLIFFLLNGISKNIRILMQKRSRNTTMTTNMIMPWRKNKGCFLSEYKRGYLLKKKKDFGSQIKHFFKFDDIKLKT